jgi:hypothetical protein
MDKTQPNLFYLQRDAILGLLLALAAAGHKNIQHTVRYTELSPTRFKDFWRD